MKKICHRPKICTLSTVLGFKTNSVVRDISVRGIVFPPLIITPPSHTNNQASSTPNSTMNPDKYNLRLRWADRLGIEFLGPVEPARWPQTHKRLFADVHELGRRFYDNFVESISIDSIEKPWRNSIRRRADRLCKLACVTSEDRKNESGWRFAVENEIMHRFSVEVAW